MATNAYKIGRFQFQGGTKTELLGSELILLENEIALERDKETGSIKMRVGDGKSKYEDCPYIDIGTISVADLTEADIAKITGPKGEPGQDLTYDMLTAEQRLELKGKPGDKGEKGDSIEVTATARNSDGSLKVTFSDGKSIDIPQGPVGPKGEPGIVKFQNLTDEEVNSIRGKDGQDGKSITVASTSKGSDGSTLVTFSDNKTISIPKGDRGPAGVDGKNGEDGKSITISSSTTANDGSIILRFSDGKSITVPRGPEGKQGAPGKDGANGADGNSISITSQTTDYAGNKVLRFSDGTSVTIPKGDRGPAGSNGSDATVYAGTGLFKSGSTIYVNTSYVATQNDLRSYAKTNEVPKLVTLTQYQYDTLSYKDPNTYYFIKE